MKAKMLVLAVAIMLVAATVQASLWDPAVDNPSFESYVDDGWNGWGYLIDDWYQEADITVMAQAVFWEWEGYVGADVDGASGSNWCGFEASGGGIYQQVGTYTANETYPVSMYLGDRFANGWGTMDVSLWSGGDASLAADGTYINTIGATLLDTVTITWADGVPSVPDPAANYVTLTLDAGSLGIDGDELWLELYGQKSYFDLVAIPEPATLALLGLGGLGLIRRRKM